MDAVPFFNGNSILPIFMFVVILDHLKRHRLNCIHNIIAILAILRVYFIYNNTSGDFITCRRNFQSLILLTLCRTYNLHVIHNFYPYRISIWQCYKRQGFLVSRKLTCSTNRNTPDIP